MLLNHVWEFYLKCSLVFHLTACALPTCNRHHSRTNPSIILHPELLSYCMCNLAFVCELIVLTTVLHEARRDRVDSYHLFALPPFNGARAWTTSFVVKREWIEMLITPGFCGGDFWFIALSGTISWRWLHSAIQQWFGELLKILPSSFRAGIVNQKSVCIACRIDFHNLRCLVPKGIAGTQKVEYFISLTEPLRELIAIISAQTQKTVPIGQLRGPHFFVTTAVHAINLLSPPRASSWQSRYFGSFRSVCEAENCVKDEKRVLIQCSLSDVAPDNKNSAENHDNNTKKLHRQMTL